jgi:hypothetical protein
LVAIDILDVCMDGNRTMGLESYKFVSIASSKLENGWTSNTFSTIFFCRRGDFLLSHVRTIYPGSMIRSDIKPTDLEPQQHPNYSQKQEPAQFYPSG